MNDDLEIIEEFQSDSINELVNERKKNRAVQRFMMRPLACDTIFKSRHSKK